MFNALFLLLSYLLLSLSSFQLSASETPKQVNSTIKSTSNINDINNSDNRNSDNRNSDNKSIQPKVTGYSPMPCVNAGAEFLIRGSNFNQLDPAVSNFNLVVQLQGKRERIEYQIKSSSLLSAVMPMEVENIASVRIGFIPDKSWGLNSIELKICPPANTEPTTLPTRPRQVSSSREINLRDAGSPAGPDKPAPDSDSDSDKDPQPDRELRQRVVNQQTQGSLLGAGLPALPQGLRLKQTNAASSYVSNELVAVSADIDQAKKLAQIMSGFQARAVRRKTMSSLGMVLSTFRLAPGYTVNQILEQLRSSNPEIWIDANHFYFPSADVNSGSKSDSNKTDRNQTKKKNNRRTNLFNSIGLTNNSQCHTKVKIGILDGPVDQKIASLAGQSIIQKQLFSRGKKAASTSHGTAVASLLVGSSKFPELTGVITHADLMVGVVMQTQPNDKKKIFSTTENLILGLNWLVEQKVNVINLSLGGPRNALLEIALNKVLVLDIGIVAAAGNSGSKEKKSYPAAQPGVIAVSALDNESNLAEDATQGDYIELSAPGVDLWVASSQSGGRYLSGSSLAAPLVAAALAQLGGSPKLSAQLFQLSKDLGEPGKDPKYGWGLLQFPPCNK